MVCFSVMLQHKSLSLYISQLNGYLFATECFHRRVAEGSPSDARTMEGLIWSGVLGFGAGKTLPQEHFQRKWSVVREDGRDVPYQGTL